MISPVSRLLSWAHRRRVLVALAAVCLAALSMLGATRLTFDTDVLSLLPRTGQVIPAFRAFVQHFGSLDELYVVFTAPEGQAISDYRDEIEDWIGRLRGADQIARVDAGLADPSRNLEWLADRQLLLMRGETLQTALGRFRGEGMRAAVAGRRELLALPSPSIARIVQQDPLGLYDLLGAQLGETIGIRAASGEDGYVSADSRSRLIIARPARPPFDTDASHALFAMLERTQRAVSAARLTPPPGEEPLPPLKVEFVGGHRIAIETEAVVRRESIMNGVMSLALILPLLFIVFRSVWLLGVGPLPSALALVVVLGALGLMGATLSAAATASAAMLFGLGVDGVVLLYVVHTLALREGQAAAGVAHLAGPASSMLLGMWTTAATFYGLTFVDFPSLQQLGALIGHAMVLCGIFTFVLVPALLPRYTKPTQRSVTMPALAGWVGRHRSRIIVAAAVATVALGALAVNVRINPTLDRLRSVTPGAVALDRIRTQFGLPQDVYVVMQRGTDLDGLLAANERLRDRIAAALPLLEFHAASSLLPSLAAQAERVAVIRRAGLAPASVAAELEVTAKGEGFRPGSFAPFQLRLPQLLDQESRISVEGFTEHGLADLAGRFVTKQGSEWIVANYAFPPGAAETAVLQRIVGDAADGSRLTGLPLVNQELGSRFMPQFAKGLAIGSVAVLVLIFATFRDWRYSLLSLAPAVIGLVWAAGLLALAEVELDLFAVFAVVTFVGIGVDYGVHVVHRCREHGDARRAIEELAPVILVAAAITLLGYGTLVTSTYPPLRSIGLVSIVAIVTLSIASVVVLPALLAGAAPEEAAVQRHHEH